MHPNAERIHAFYTSFQRRDHAGMAACYHPDVVFSDAVFQDLKGWRVAAMWQMLCERGEDLRIAFGGVEADDAAGRAHWEAWYTFRATGHRVHNSIEAAFTFRDGLIIAHRDAFDLRAWTAQALGWTGRLLGWAAPVQQAVRRRAEASLQAFIDRRGLGPG